MEVEVKISGAFVKWLKVKKRLKIAFGGRGGSKSESIARMLIVKSFELTGKIFCARETQKSMVNSIYPLLVSIIKVLELHSFFTIYKNEIINNVTGCKFIFLGIKEHSVEEIKSIYNVQICFIEEAQQISAGSWEILEPSVRAEESEIWLAFNPRKSSDIAYQLVQKFTLKEVTYVKDDKELRYHEYEDNDVLITKVNFYSNLFFSEVLEKSRQMTLRMQPALYGYIWLGELKRQQGKIFSDSTLRFFNALDYKNNLDIHYVKKAIIDPAFGKDNCFTSCIIYSRIGKDFYIHDAGLMRSDGVRTTDELLIEFLKRNNIRQVMCEANFHQSELVKKLKRHFEVNPFYVKQNKIERIVNASILIRENVLFDDESLTTPEAGSTEDWITTVKGRNFIAMMQLLDFSDIQTENCIAGDDFSYVDFPDCLASLVLYSPKTAGTVSYANSKFAFGIEGNGDGAQDIKQKKITRSGGGYGLNR